MDKKVDVYKRADGRWAVNTDDGSYVLEPWAQDSSFALLEGVNLGMAREGLYGETMQIYVKACEKVGIYAIAYGYRGIRDGDGRHSSAYPPYKPLPHDSGRAESLPWRRGEAREE